MDSIPWHMGIVGLPFVRSIKSCSKFECFYGHFMNVCELLATQNIFSFTFTLFIYITLNSFFYPSAEKTTTLYCI